MLRKGIWHLGTGKKQTGGFLPLLAPLPKPILISVAG